MNRPSDKTIVLISVILGSISIIFFGAGTLADVFYFLAGIVGISAFIRERQLRGEVRELRRRISEKIEELQHTLDELEGKTEKT